MVYFACVALIMCLLSADCALHINEVAPSGGGAACGHNDWVELYNDANSEADISGYRLCDRNGCSDSSAYTFPANSKIASNGYLVVCKKNGTQQPGFEFGVGTSDTVSFADTGGNELSSTGAMKGRSDGYTYARLQSGSFDYVATATPGAVNDQTLAPFACLIGQACWDLFDTNQLRSYNLEITSSNLAKMTEDIRAEAYVPCKVTVNYGTAQAEIYPDAGCRTKGSVGAFHGCADDRDLTQSQPAQPETCRKLSIKVDANFYNSASNVRFHGLKKLQLHAMIADASLTFERLAYNLFQRSNMIASRAVHAKVYVNAVSNGVHLLVEQIDDRFLDARLKDKVVANSTLYKDLWLAGCTSPQPDRTCPKTAPWEDATCANCMSCIGGACDVSGCYNGECYGGKDDSRCDGRPRWFDLRDGGWCDYSNGKLIRMAKCQDMTAVPENCYHKKRRDGTGEYENLFSAIKSESDQCISNDCSQSQALQIVDKYFNKSALVDAFVATLFDMDQFTTLYDGTGGAHNFYTYVNNDFDSQTDKVTMVPWDFDRGMSLCKVSRCPGGGYLGDLTHNGKETWPAGHIEGQRETPWGRCFMPPWFTDVTKISELNQKYCVDGVTTFHKHKHASCDALLNVFARALKNAYATRMLEVLDGAEVWAEQHLTAWRAQISTAVAEDANNGGYPKFAQWQQTEASSLQRAKDVFAWGRKLAAAAASAAQNQNVEPTAPAKTCVKNGQNANNPLLTAQTTTLGAFPQLQPNGPQIGTSTVASTTGSTESSVASSSSTSSVVTLGVSVAVGVLGFRTA